MISSLEVIHDELYFETLDFLRGITDIQADEEDLPEAKVRRHLYDKWVQPFANYSPYLFRDYWIPRGWFAYFNTVTLPVYEPWTQAAEDLKCFIIREINAEARIAESKAKFYDRYDRWAARWQPHPDYLEIDDGVNLYAKRRSSRETRLTPRRRMTFVEETPELMDETAHGPWLEFLCEQSPAYVRAHIKYLAQVRHQTARIEEESEERKCSRSLRGNCQPPPKLVTWEQLVTWNPRSTCCLLRKIWTSARS